MLNPAEYTTGGRRRSRGLKTKTLRRMCKSKGLKTTGKKATLMKRLHMRGGGVMQKMGDDGKPVEPAKWISDKTGQEYDSEAAAKEAEVGVEGPDLKPPAMEEEGGRRRRRRRSRRREGGGKRRQSRRKITEVALGH